MKASVWLAAKPGEERRYTSATGWTPEFRCVLRRDGYELFEVEFELPRRYGGDCEKLAGKAVGERGQMLNSPVPIPEQHWPRVAELNRRLERGEIVSVMDMALAAEADDREAGR